MDSASPPFVCKWSAVGDCAIVRVNGDVDVVAVPTLETELRHVITTKLPKLVVDLRRVKVMEPAGIAVLASAHQLAVEHGGWLRTSGAARWLMDLIPNPYGSLAEALPAYRPS
ncbi:STAS domain-containing protein [Kribbella sp. NPDC051952]|uniref:STAS domain-containing protein n=1 Tax=Kribbella sp. NPDC051952 TaxID=3154851 RepID=UPI0034375EC6